MSSTVLPLNGTDGHFSFDQARLIRQKREMSRNGIDPLTGEHGISAHWASVNYLLTCTISTGLPTDPRAVTRL